jgi:outer membrane receptor protein involved in Fe transport
MTGVLCAQDTPLRHREVIDVTASAPLLQSSRGTTSFQVENRRVVNLPLDGRNFVPLIALAPGVNLPPGSTLPRINGSRPRVSEYIYDGISVLQPEPGQVAFYPIIDAIEEFRVEINSYSSEYGRSNGGVILVTQKSGTNDLHGTLFEFFRNEKLNARNLFAPAGPEPRFRRNQYGFVLGGPIRRNRTFFFVDWQGTRLNTGVTRVSTVPLAAWKRGVFTTPILDPLTREPFPNNIIPASRFDPVAVSLLSRYPEGSSSLANNYRRTGNDDTGQDQFDTRIDHYLNRTQRVFGRFAWLRDDSRPTTPLPDGSGNITSGILSNTHTTAASLAAEHAWNLTPGSVNQARFGYTRRGFRRKSGVDDLPIYDIVGLQQLGPPSNSRADFTTSVTQFLDTFSTVRNRHTMKAGVDIRLERLDVLQPPAPNGQYQFSSILTGNSFASFLLGQVQRYSIDVQPEKIGQRASIAEAFVQDDWRATGRLTLNLGVRYTLNFPSTVKDDRGAVFNLKTQKLDFLGQNGYPRTARDLEKLNFGPRAGLAFRATDSFVIRAGYGLTWIEQAGITTPFTTPLFPFIQTLTELSLDNLRPAFVLSNGPSVRAQPPNPDSGLGQGVFAVQRDNGSGYAQQWNLTLQKTFNDRWSVEAGYLGSKLTRLGIPDTNLNQLRVEDLKAGVAVQQVRPYPNYTTVTLYRNNTGHSTYHAFQSHVRRRFANRITFTGAYTFSKLIDDAGAVFDAAILTGPVTNYQAADSFNRRLEKDVSTGNVPHNFSGSFVWELPFRIQFAGIARWQSGSPVAVTQATNFNAFAGFGTQRPNRVGNPELRPHQRSTARWFNTSAFTQAGQYAIGTSSRNPVTGPGYRTLDLMVGKTFRLSDRFNTELRAEAFNVTNTPPLGNPNGSFGSAAFGSITTALDPRVFELVMKVSF